jgi:hypothetical protein
VHSISTPNRADWERAAANLTLGKAKLMDIDSNPPADEGEGGEAMHEPEDTQWHEG